MTNRRGFMASLVGAASVAIIDPEFALWTPGKKIISIPKPSGLQKFTVVDIDGDLFNLFAIEQSRNLDGIETHIGGVPAEIVHQPTGLRRWLRGVQPGDTVTVDGYFPPYPELTPAQRANRQRGGRLVSVDYGNANHKKPTVPIFVGNDAGEIDYAVGW